MEVELPTIRLLELEFGVADVEELPTCLPFRYIFMEPESNVKITWFHPAFRPVDAFTVFT
jgi:hypothetical protein